MPHHRSRGRHDDDLVDDEDDEFHDVGSAGHGGAYGAVEDASGPFGDEDDEDIDLLDRHNRNFNQRRRSSMVAGRDGGSLGSGESGSAKIPSVKFISRSGTGRSYISRKDLL